MHKFGLNCHYYCFYRGGAAYNYNCSYHSVQCAPNKNVLKRKKQNPLKMILLKEAGSRFQMDLVEMPYFNGYNYILRVVDHLSKFGYVYPLKTKTSEEVGKSLLCILTSIMPRILQSDNGGEVRFCNLFSVIITIFFMLQKPFRSYLFFRIFL